MDEFDFIEKWLNHFEKADLAVPPGDDAAAFIPGPGMSVVITTDAMVDGIHFISSVWPPECVGQKILAVNLSDIAAMGATPKNVLLALELPEQTDDKWLFSAAEGMANACRSAGVFLIGGNVSRGNNLSFTLTLTGEARPENLLRRSGARPGDIIWISGTTGDSALGLQSMLKRKEKPEKLDYLETRHCMPTPRSELGIALSKMGAASAAIDISDGLLSDLGHILSSSKVGAKLRIEDIPVSKAYRKRASALPDFYLPALTGGEDYELLFTSPPKFSEKVKEASRLSGVPLSPAGQITSERGLELISETNENFNYGNYCGWRHR